MHALALLGCALLGAGLAACSPDESAPTDTIHSSAGQGGASGGEAGTAGTSSEAGSGGSGQGGQPAAGQGGAGNGGAPGGAGGSGGASSAGSAGQSGAGGAQAGAGGSGGSGQSGAGGDAGAGGSDAGAGGDGGAPAYAVTHRILVLNYDPLLPAHGGKRVSEFFGWNAPKTLAQQYASDMHEASHGAVTYEIAEWKDLDTFPAKIDGFAYDEASYVACMNKEGPCHAPDSVDYPAIVDQFALCSRIEQGEIDEIWMFGGPYFGYWESTMAGDDAFWMNSPPVPSSCSRRFILMGFNYERGVGEMLHDFGHRVESTMTRAFEGWPGAEPNPYALFRRYDKATPGEARCGDTHNPPNATEEYAYSQTEPVLSRCDAYLAYPDLSAPPKATSCEVWGCDQRGFLRWMFQHLPRAEGSSGGYHDNWWKYLLDFDANLP